MFIAGLPPHQNGMYGINQGIHHFSSFDGVRSLPLILNQSNDYWYGMIGKKHVGPSYVYPFPFSYTELDGYDLNLVGRNITFMNEKMQDFLTLAKEKKKPFFLYMAFFDVHRCEAGGPLGGFCELYGDGGEGHGTIPDWTPKTYDPSSVEVPYYIPDTVAARADIAAQYRSVNRMDQGVGLFMKTLADNGFDDENTLIIFTSDNGIPFPGAKTNLYEPGMKIPLMISNPTQKQRWGVECFGRTTTADLFLTVIDWLDLDDPKYELNGVNVTFTGKSLIDATAEEPSPRDPNFAIIYSSHDFHGISMYYPMRVIREEDIKLIHNLNFKMPYPVAQDVFQSPTFQEILGNKSNGWFKDLHSYYYRSEWELYDLSSDPQETKNLIDDPSQKPFISSMKEFLVSWQNITNDPWLCSPGGELVGTAGTCKSLSNGF